MSTICTRQQVITHKYNITEEKDTNLTPEQVFSTTITCHKQKEPKKITSKEISNATSPLAFCDHISDRR